MGRIHVLDDSVINKIAAGEVVERPASVVKELVENALDAGATRIDVAVELGGTRSLVVTDDGMGMSPDDAALAVVRHATSKIQCADDLFNISSMGFRGEALASIAAVSRFTLSTRPRGADRGTRHLLHGGEAVQPVQAWNGPSGTSIAVENLFFNLPVRAKFLKAPATEYSHCLELIQAFALANPQVGFSLSHNGREQFRVAGVTAGAEVDSEQALRARATAVLGKETAETLQYITAQSRFGQVSGLVSPPGCEKVSSKHIVTFVNGRWVKDKTIRYGVLRGYHSHLMKGRFPVAIIDLRMDPSLVDVNVHPAKTELRFQYPTEVQNLLALAIRERLREADWAQAPVVSESQPRASSVLTASEPVNARSSRAEAAPPRIYTGTPADGASSTARLPRYGVRSFDGARVQPATVMPLFAPPAALNFDGGDRSVDDEADLAVDEREKGRAARIPWTEMDFIGSFARCYLMFDHGEHLLVVDQHAFHERILFERLSRDESLLGKSQPLLVVEAVELSPTQVQELRARRHLLVKRGFDFEAEGDTTVAVKAVPSILVGRNMVDLMADLARELVLDESVRANADLATHLLATTACHAAVRSGEALGPDELKQLLAEAHRVDFFHNCPHGRRVLKWWTREQVARWFDR